MEHIIENKIYIIRGRKVMLDRDLAVLYGVTAKRLNEQVKRNIERFPADFMFQLTEEESHQFGSRSQIATLNDESGLDEPILRSQFATSSEHQDLRFQNGTSRLQHGGQRYRPYAFTEQGVAMLSSVLRSKQAIQVNIQIMRTFTKIREMLASNSELRKQIEQLEQKYDKQFTQVFAAIKLLLEPPTNPPGKIGFRTK